jgi:hypothetical protein
MRSTRASYLLTKVVYEPQYAAKSQIAELITTGHTAEVIRPFSPDRFQLQAIA